MDVASLASRLYDLTSEVASNKQLIETNRQVLFTCMCALLYFGVMMMVNVTIILLYFVIMYNYAVSDYWRIVESN